jgi:hypothetical protein
MYEMGQRRWLCCGDPGRNGSIPSGVGGARHGITVLGDSGRFIGEGRGRDGVMVSWFIWVAIKPFVGGGELSEGESIESFIAEAMNRTRPEIYRVNPVVAGIGDTGAV